VHQTHDETIQYSYVNLAAILGGVAAAGIGVAFAGAAADGMSPAERWPVRVDGG
jgi:hypothetical protein